MRRFRLPLLPLAFATLLPAQSAHFLALFKGTSALAYLANDGAVLATVPVGAHPHEAVFSPDGALIYTSDNGTMRVEHPGAGGNTISIVSLSGRNKIGEISLGENHRPHGMALDPKSGRLLVTTEAPDRVVLIDTYKRHVIRAYETRGKTSHMVTFGPHGDWAYVSNAGSSNISMVNLPSGQVTLVEVGARPEGSVLSADGKELYVTLRDANAIAVVDTDKKKLIANISTGKGPVRIALTPDGTTLVYALMYEKRIGFADPKARRQMDYALLTQNPVSCNLSKDGKYVFASAEEQDRIFIVSVASRRLTRQFAVPGGSAPDPVFSAP